MVEKLLEPFSRQLNEGQEPTDHQRKFLYLPLSMLRDFTNIESIVTDTYIANYAKLPSKTEVEKTIEKYHQQLGQLNKWKHWKLSKLEFRSSHTNTW